MAITVSENANVSQTDKILPVGRDEQAPVKTVVNGSTVDTFHTVKPNDEGQQYNLHWTFDFENVSQEELMLLAERTIRIRKQAAWRAAADKMDAKKWHNVTFNVRDMLDNHSRQPVDPVQKAANMAKKMSPEEKAALLKLLQQV